MSTKEDEDALDAAAAAADSAEKEEQEGTGVTESEEPSSKKPAANGNVRKMKRPGACPTSVTKGKGQKTGKGKAALKRPAGKGPRVEATAVAIPETPNTEGTEDKQPQEKKLKTKAKLADEEKAKKLIDGVEVDTPEVDQGEAAGTGDKELRDSKKAYFFHKHFSKLPDQVRLCCFFFCCKVKQKVVLVKFDISYVWSGPRRLLVQRADTLSEECAGEQFCGTRYTWTNVSDS